MEAPDKVLLYTQTNPEQDVEYIRKDALVEWAKEESSGNVGATYKVAMSNLIQKLNSM